MTRWRLYDRKLSVSGDTEKDRNITQAKEAFLREVIENPGFQPKACRNGIEQQLLIDRTDVAYKYKVAAFPDEALNVGDILEIKGEHLIVVETRILNEIQVVGTAWVCNHLFRFQNGTPEIIERWGVLDSGVYSTTLKGDNMLQTLHKQFKVYLPYDEDTKKLYIDKRIAVGKSYNSNGNEILVCMKYTGEDPISRSYGKDGHLLIMNVESAEYNQYTDSVEELICDYISTSQSATPTETSCEILGRSAIKIGSIRNYNSRFYDVDGIALDTVIPTWKTSTLPLGVECDISNNILTLSVDNNDSLIGEKISIELSGDEASYGTATLVVEVVG